LKAVIVLPQTGHNARQLHEEADRARLEEHQEEQFERGYHMAGRRKDVVCNAKKKNKILLN